MRYLRDLLAISLDGAGRIAVALGIGPGVLAVLALAGVVKEADAPLQQWTLWVLASSAVGFLAYALLIGPYLLVKKEKEARKKAEETAAAKPADQRQGAFYLESAHVETLNMYIGLTGPSGEVLSSSNKIVRGPDYDAVLVPSGDIEVYPGTARLEIKAFPPTIEITENDPSSPAGPRSPRRSKRDR